MKSAWTCALSIINITLGRLKEEGMKGKGGWEGMRHGREKRKMWDAQGRRKGEKKKWERGHVMNIERNGWKGVKGMTAMEQMENSSEKGRQIFPQQLHKEGKKSELKENDRREGRECVGKRNAGWHVMLLRCTRCFLSREERQTAWKRGGKKKTEKET